MDFLGDVELERSSVVANCRMNRGRGLVGSNGYARELGFHPLDLAPPDRPFRWLDLCCGQGRALGDAARAARDRGGPAVAITGVDLVGMFDPGPGPLPGLHLVEASVSTWSPRLDDRFDLITCVHGLHYVGDKLNLIARAAGWLADDGRFVATLDLANLHVVGVASPARHLRASFRRAGLPYDERRRLIRRAGCGAIALPYTYLGADAAAGPNFTGQPAVRSIYRMAGEPRGLDMNRNG